jgi:hypothetical protein
MRRVQSESVPPLVEVVVEAAAVVATDGHPVTVELAIVD